MICRQCLRRASALRPQFHFPRFISTTPIATSPVPAAAPSTNAAQPFSNPLSSSNTISAGKKPRSQAGAAAIPVSYVPAGTPLKGINYMKDRDDPIALEEHEYPEWLWRCLDVKKDSDALDENTLDEFSKSKKIRRKAAKRQRKIDEKNRLSGKIIEPKIPLAKQSIDLPTNELGTAEGALAAEQARKELRTVMRKDRRSGIKEKNFLKSM